MRKPSSLYDKDNPDWAPTLHMVPSIINEDDLGQCVRVRSRLQTPYKEQIMPTYAAEKSFENDFPAKIGMIMEGDKGPVPQMLFVNEAYLHSQVLQSYDTNTSVEVKQENDEQCPQHPECYDTKTSVAVKQEVDELCPQHPEPYDTKTSVAMKAVDELCPQHLEPYDTKTSVAMKEDDELRPQHPEPYDELRPQHPESYDELCSQLQPSSLEIKTEIHTVDDLSSQTYVEAFRMKRNETEVNLIYSSSSSQILQNDELDVVTDRLVSGHSGSLLVTNDCGHIEEENDDFEFNMSYKLKKSDSGLNQETPYEIKIERDEEVGVPTNVCPTTCVDDRSSEFFGCKQESVQDSGPNRDEHSDTDMKSSPTTNCHMRTLPMGSDDFPQQQQTPEDRTDKFSGNSQLCQTDERLDKQETEHKSLVCKETLHTMETRLRKRVQKNLYKCDVCHKAFGQKSQLTTHVKKTHKEEKNFKCTFCGEAFLQSSKLTTHMRIHSGEKPYKCTICKKRFIDKSKFTTHMRIHTSEELKKPYKCTICEKEIIHKTNFKRHLRTHTSEKPNKCTVCEKSFVDNCKLTTHMRIHTGEEPKKPYKCTVCKKAFVYKSKLTTHMKIHSGEKHHKCSVCHKAFMTNYDVIRHMRIHTGEKPYKCTVCAKAFTSKGEVKKHIKIHTGEKPYKCSDCGKEFIESCKLARHKRRKITCKKTYKCTGCGKAFIRRSDIAKHMRLHR